MPVKMAMVVSLVLLFMIGMTLAAETKDTGGTLSGRDCYMSLMTSVVWWNCHHQHQSFQIFDRVLTDPSQIHTWARRICAEMRPRAYRCFQRKVNQCHNKDVLLEIARNTGGLCGDRDFLPWVYEASSKGSPMPYNMAFVNESITNVACQNGMVTVRLGCVMGMRNIDPQLKRSSRVADLQTKADLYMQNFYTCLLSKYRDAVQGRDGNGFGLCLQKGEKKSALVQLYTSYLFNDQFGYRIRPQQIQDLLIALDE